jgi:two-component system CheB/CheR fusion protein
MQVVGCQSYVDYLDFLEVHPDEFSELFDTLLINVTSFFRDAAAWQYLQDHVLPDLAGADEDRAIRVWCAGCATGEEAYSVAISLAEVLGEDAYRERVKIYATDIDEQALDHARQAVYAANQLEALAPELREKYFERADQRYAFRADLRRMVIFGRNNLLEDAPISKLDLLVSRNTLMYFTAETQSRIVRHFHFALRDDGALMLGKSEMLLTHRNLFEAIDLKQRVFRKVGGRPSLQTRLARAAKGERPDVPLAADERRSRDAALDVGAAPLLIVSRSGLLTFANLTARAIFGVGMDALGQPFQDLSVSYQPVELRGPVDEALGEGRLVPVGEVTLKPTRGEERRLDITVTPLFENGGTPLGVAIVFDDVTRYATAQRELERHRRDLELASEELQTTIDELETTNEELQSANEELQTTNEELQSTNEELETMNEELYSTNEELETINDELRDRTAELNEVNDFLEAILTSLGLAVAVLDRDQRVAVWNDEAADLWGTRPDEAVEQHFLALDIGLPTEQLVPALRSALGVDGRRARVRLDAINRRGRTIVCETTVMPLFDGRNDGRPRGAIVLMRDITGTASDGAGADGAAPTGGGDGRRARSRSDSAQRP